jgi:hypothetical protein
MAKERFKSDYTTEKKISEKEKGSQEEAMEKKKTILNNEAYAIGEAVSTLIDKIEHIRMELIK